jgi:shikimate dehydrogenase
VVTIGGRTRLAAVLGWPVEHSRSPALHNAAFAAVGLDAVFVALAVPPARLPEAVAGLRALGVLGASITVPHKQAIVPLCDALADSATRVGAVNCLAFDGGRVIGHNTDAAGFVDALREAGHEPAGRRAVVLGGGGAARAVVVGLGDAGADVAVVARRPETVDWAAAQPWTATALAALSPGCELWVDATSMGLHDAPPPAPVPLERSPGAVVCSLLYHRDTALVSAARALGLAVVDGAGMLVHQGARAFALWTGRPAPLDAMWRAMRAAGRSGA